MSIGLIAIFISKHLKNKKLYVWYPTSHGIEVKVKPYWDFFNFLIGSVCPLIIPMTVGFLRIGVKHVQLKTCILIALLFCIVVNKLNDNWDTIWEDGIKSHHSSLFIHEVEK